MKTVRVCGLMLSMLCFLGPTSATWAQTAAGFEKMAAAKPKLKFKWHGSGSSCETPLGICISIPIGLAETALTDREIEEGYGTATFQVIDEGLLRMVFDREAALPDGTIRIDFDKELESPLAEALGYRSITLLGGVYQVDFSTERFGEVVVRISHGERLSP